MIQNFNLILTTLDITGATPQLFIFNNKRYKSIFSSIISILIILASIGFIINSLYEYINEQTPNVAYSKDNDKNTERSFLLNDFVLAFQLVDAIDTFDFNTINDSIAFYQADLTTYYNNGSMDYKLLDIEYCKFGKNIDLKYKNLFRTGNSYGRSLEEFYCLNTLDTNLSLFYIPNIGFNIITIYIIYKNNTIYSPEKLQSLIVSENNIIDHNNKKNPINNNYIFQFTGAYSSLEFTKINYNFRYIKYESDEGIFYQKSKFLKGISFSDMISYRNNRKGYNLKNNLENNEIIGAIGIAMTQSYYDSYKRVYKRLPALLAEVMSVINLLLELGRQISKVLCGKRMAKDIIENLLNENKNYSIPNNKIKHIIKKNEKNIFISERKKIIDDTNFINFNNNKKNDDIKSDIGDNKKGASKIKIIKKVKVNNKIMKKIDILI